MNGLKMLAMWLFTGALVACIAGWPQLYGWLKGNEQLAAWVQAIGTVVAIAATGWSVKHSHDLQEEQRKRERFDEYTDLLEGVFQLVGGAASVTRKMLVFVDDNEEVDGANVGLMASEIEALKAALERVDASRLASYKVVQAVLVANAQLPVLIKSLHLALRHVRVDGSMGTHLFIGELRHANETLEPQAKLLDRLISERQAARP